MQSLGRFGSGVDGEVEGLATDFVWRCLPSQSGLVDDAKEQEEGSRCPSEEKTAPCGGREQQESTMCAESIQGWIHFSCQAL